jgi:glycosyltransferase Alg8
MTRLFRWQNISSYLNWFALLCLSAFGFTGFYLLRNPERLDLLGISGLISMGLIGIWRWSWWALQVIRSRIYLHWVFPRWRKQADRIPLDKLPPVCLLVPTYKEKPWITERVFRVIAQEAQSLSHPLTLLVTSSSDAENTAILKILKSVDPELSCIRLIQMVQTGEGKRKAMADGLRELARLNLPQNAVVGLMDGDSELTPGTLRRCLSFFRLFPKMGALTTDELPIVEGSYLFSEWFHLRLSQRHYQMCSVSLSQKVMCLTGRFSLFRAEAALHPTFADQLELDTLDDWLWGRFKFLSGDDKTTWYWLLRRGYDMLYIPDVIVYSIETISGSLMDRAYQNMRRWYGNMLRNSDRAIGLGPGKAGWFMWYCLLDQRISYWTTLITPGSLSICLVQGYWLVAGVILCWILCTRPIILTIIFWGRQSRLKPIHLPVFLIAQWSSCIIKIWTQMNLAQQKWSNRGNQSISAAGSGWERLVKVSVSRFLYVSQLFGFVIILCWFASLLSPLQDVTGLWSNSTWALSQSVPPQIVEAIDHGIIPNDGQDDAKSLQVLINRLSVEDPVQINLPIGEIDLFYPIEINRSHTIIKGQGMRRTILQAHISKPETEAVLVIRPREHRLTEQAESNQNQIQDIHLSGFTLRKKSLNSTENISGFGSILLETVVDSSLRNLDLANSSNSALILRHTEDVTVEYVLPETAIKKKE